MTMTIALAGKGGVGKTTLAALIVHILSRTQEGSILAIDADPSSNLNMALGLDLEWTVGDIREDLLTQVKSSLLGGGAAMGALPGGVTKRDYLDYHVRSSVSEGEAFDLIAMGRSEGSGCYCAVNHNLRQVIDAISKNYRFVVIDNEAGMEHLSRRTTRDVDILLVVSDPGQRGLAAADRIAAFRNELDIRIHRTGLVLNRVEGELPPAVRQRVEALEIPLLGVVPADPELAEAEINGRPVISISERAPVFKAVEELIRAIF
jgi:CO dehydrogenase maturation factor